MIEQQLLRAILANQSIIFGQCGGARDGETFTIRTQTGSIPARAYGAIAPGQCVAYRVGGQWLAVSAGVAQRLNQYVLEFQRRSNVLVPATGNVVHLFVATESYVILDEFGFRQEMTGIHSYWLASGDKVLKVFESNEYTFWNTLEPLFDIPIVDKIIPDLLEPGYRLENHLFWVLSDTRFLIQLKLHDYTDVVNYDGGYPPLESFIKPQVFTALIDNWEIVASDLQTADDYIRFENPYPEIIYPPEFNDVLDWLTPRHNINFNVYSGAIPVVDEVQETYPSFEFSFNTRDNNINANRIPTRVQYVFRPQDAMGSSGSYEAFGGIGSSVETYTTGSPFEGSNYWTWAPLELNAIEREWQVFSPNGTKTVLSPRTAYNLIGTNYHMFTDTQPLIKNSSDILFFYIPELREGSVDPSELFGSFWVLQSALTGYPTYESNLFWLTAKSA